MMALTNDTATVNAIANHPDVRPFLGGEGPADLGPTMAHPRSLTWLMEGGAFLCVHAGYGIYDVHSLFMPEARRHTRRAMEFAVREMFQHLGAVELVTTIPEHNKAASALAKLGGFTFAGFRDRAWPVLGGPDTVTWWSLTKDAWELRHVTYTASEPICLP